MNNDDGKKIFDPLADALNIESELIPFGNSEIDLIVPDRFQEIVDADYDFARRNIMETLMKAQEALDKLIPLAVASQAPRAFEVIATLTNVIVNSNRDLLELAKANKELKDSGEPEESNVTNNTLIVTTDQLQKLLKKEGVETTTRKAENGS